MFANICNGLINFGGPTVCVDDDYDLDEIVEYYDNSVYDPDELTSSNDDGEYHF